MELKKINREIKADYADEIERKDSGLLLKNGNKEQTVEKTSNGDPQIGCNTINN